MMDVCLQDVAEWAGGVLVSADGGTEICGVAIDSRTVREGELFVALVGENYDGHDFVHEALERGAVAAMVSRADCEVDGPMIIVEDTLHSLGDLAHQYRWSRHLIPWVAVTGSNGKTTTREMIACILRTRGEVASSPRNYNNLIGLPLTLLNHPEDAWVGVVEMGASIPGEIARLTDITTPTVGVVTCVAPSHLEGFGSIETIANEKAAIFSRIPEDGLAVYPGYHDFRHIFEERAPGNRASFAMCGADGMEAEDIVMSAEGLSFTVDGVKFSLPLIGMHNVSNCMAALIVARHFGVSLEESAVALRKLAPVEGRLSGVAGTSLSIIDDTYNANPTSVHAAIEALVELPATRRVAIVGDMLELGEQSRYLHCDTGRWMSNMGLDIILVVGRESLALAECAASSNASTKVRHFPTISGLIKDIKSLLCKDDLVLVKGSRGMRMEQVVERLKRLKLSS